MDASGDSWVARSEIDEGTLAAYERAAAAATRDMGENGLDDRGEERNEEEAQMAYRMFASIQDAALSRTMSDCSYSVLTDALPLGRGRCQKQVRRGECDLCWIMLGKREPETTRHLASGCPFSAMAQEAVLRAAFDTTMVDAEARESIEKMSWKELTQTQTRLLTTGYRHCPKKGGGMAEERVASAHVGRAPSADRKAK